MLLNKFCFTGWLVDLRLLTNKTFKLCSYNVLRQLSYVQNICENEKHDLKFEDKRKLVKVAIIGLPNAGKSTLINNLMDRKVCPASNKVHTTRKRSNSVITEGETQIVFLDTPGVISNAEQRRYKLEKSFFKDCESSLHETDLIGIVHDISNMWTRDRLDIKIIRLLERFKKKTSFLVLNKIDVLKSKRKLLDVTRNLTSNRLNSIPLLTQDNTHQNDIRGWPHFSEIFMISALNGDGVEDIKNYLLENSYSAPWKYPSTEWTDQSPEDIIVKTVQATLLDFLPQEIPYRLKTQMEFMEILENGTIKSVVLVHCPHERIKKLVVGAGNGKLRQIVEKVQNDLTQTFYSRVSLQIVVTCNSEKNK